MDDIVFEIFKIVPEDDGLNFALTCKQTYNIWEMEILWKIKLLEFMPNRKIKSLVKKEKLTYLKYNWIVNGIILVSLCETIYDNHPEFGRKMDFITYCYHTNSLTELDLTATSLTTIPAFICEIKSLQTLLLDDNNIRSIPRYIRKSQNLEVLSLRDNKLHHINPVIGHLSKLQELNLSNNKLTTLPSTITLLSNLALLNLQYNMIDRLPSGMENLINLEILKMNSNRLFYLPKELTLLPKLKTLHIFRNKRLKIDDIFMKYQSDIYVNNIKIKNINTIS